MNMTPLPSTEPINLAKLATILAVIFGIAFGLCTVSAVTSGLGSQKLLPFLIDTSLVIEAGCLLGLLVVGALAIARSFSSRFRD